MRDKMGGIIMNKEIRRDGHVHTPFCPHGSQDSLSQYVEQAMKLGRKQITFTEHFLLPMHIGEVTFLKECALQEEVIEKYLEAVTQLQREYQGQISILKGFEVDYIEGEEDWLREKLNEYGPSIEDSILSVHFVYYKGKYYAIDCLEQFEALYEETKDLELIYELYFKTLLKSIKADIGQYKPQRIGHPTLIRIFNQKYPFAYKNEQLLDEIMEALKEKNMMIDFNSAGLRKMYCKETYPSGLFLKKARERNISLVPGSDAHESQHMLVLEGLKDK